MGSPSRAHGHDQRPAATLAPLFYYGSHDTVRHTVLSLFFLAKALAELLAVRTPSAWLGKVYLLSLLELFVRILA